MQPTWISPRTGPGWGIVAGPSLFMHQLRPRSPFVLLAPLRIGERGKTATMQNLNERLPSRWSPRNRACGDGCLLPSTDVWSSRSGRPIGEL